MAADRPVRVAGSSLSALLLAALGAQAYPTGAQVPAPQSQPPLMPYHAPVIAIVQPSPGGSVTQDKPVVVLRFAPGEASDPIDAASFAIVVNGVDRSALFQVAANEAWGSVAPSEELAPGSHQLVARICSARGACASVAGTVTVVSSPVPVVSSPASARSRKRKLLDALLAAGKKLLTP